MGGTRRQGHKGSWLGDSWFALGPTLLVAAGACGDPDEPLFPPGSGGNAAASANGAGARAGAPPGQGGVGGAAPEGGQGAASGRVGAGGQSASGSSGGATGKAGTGGRPAAGGESGAAAEGGSGGFSAGQGGGGGKEKGDGGVGAQGNAGEGGHGGSHPFDCDSFDGRGVTAKCFDFATSDSSTRWLADGGQWAVSSGAYVGNGPATPRSCANGSQMTASLVAGFSARDVRLHAQLTGVQRADKVLVFRARDAQNRVELNFRALYPEAGGDLVIQELSNCVQTLHVLPGVLLLPHELTQTIAVDVELRGQSLAVWVDGRQIFRGEVPVSSRAGAVGVGVINDGVTRFDDVYVQSLD